MGMGAERIGSSVHVHRYRSGPRVGRDRPQIAPASPQLNERQRVGSVGSEESRQFRRFTLKECVRWLSRGKGEGLGWESVGLVGGLACELTTAPEHRVSCRTLIAEVTSLSVSFSSTEMSDFSEALCGLQVHLCSGPSVAAPVGSRLCIRALSVWTGVLPLGF